MVDDNKMNLKVAMGLLAPLQMQIDTVENGKEAVEQGKFRDLVIIALTADAMSGAREEFIAAGMNDFVAKPIEIKEICTKLKRYLPKEKIVRTKEPVIAEEVTEVDEQSLPVIDGLHVAEGVRYSGGLELYTSLLGDYYKLIDAKITKIRQCLADHMIRDLTIEVHALKNTSRMIRALELSERFKELELLGNAQDQKRLEEKTPEVLKLYQSYKKVLKPYGTVDEASLRTGDAATLKELLTRMQDAMDGFDLDGVDAAMAELETYRMPECIRDLMEQLRACVADVAMEEVIRLCGEMKERLQGDHSAIPREAEP